MKFRPKTENIEIFHFSEAAQRIPKRIPIGYERVGFATVGYGLIVRKNLVFSGLKLVSNADSDPRLQT